MPLYGVSTLVVPGAEAALISLGTAATTNAADFQQGDAQLSSLAALAYASNSLKVIRVNAGETDFELAALAGGGDMLKADNLSGLANYGTAWTNMGISSAATLISSYWSISSHVHSASEITSSTLAVARIAAGTANISTFADGTGNWSVPVYGSISSLPVLGTVASTAAANYASSTHVHSASDITSSTLALARMGGGTTNVSTFLNGTGNFSQPVYASISALPKIALWVSTVFATSIKFSTTTSSLAFPELAFLVSTGLQYKFEFGIVFATAISTTGLKLSMLFPAASTWAATARIPIAADGAGGEFQGWITASGDTVTGTAIQAASTQYFAEVRGVILPTSDGTLQLTYGTEIAGSAVTTFVGSYGVLTQY